MITSSCACSRSMCCWSEDHLRRTHGNGPSARCAPRPAPRPTRCKALPRLRAPSRSCYLPTSITAYPSQAERGHHLPWRPRTPPWESLMLDLALQGADQACARRETPWVEDGQTSQKQHHSNPTGPGIQRGVDSLVAHPAASPTGPHERQFPLHSTPPLPCGHSAVACTCDAPPPHSNISCR